MTLFQGAPPSDIPPEAIEIIKIVCATIVIMVLGIPIIRAFTRRLERGSPPPQQIPTDVTNRLERIEQAVDAIAIEVERVSESQRFVTKLLNEQKQRSLPGSDAMK